MSRPRELESKNPNRQRAWQEAQKKAGRCQNCGNKRKNYWCLCDKCQEKKRIANRARTGFAPWAKGKPGRPPVVKNK